jgi:hypothetical protein
MATGLHSDLVHNSSPKSLPLLQLELEGESTEASTSAAEKARLAKYNLLIIQIKVIHLLQRIGSFRHLILIGF